MGGRLVSPAVADEAERAFASGWDPSDGLPSWERELVAVDLEEVDELQLRFPAPFSDSSPTHAFGRQKVRRTVAPRG